MKRFTSHRAKTKQPASGIATAAGPGSASTNASASAKSGEATTSADKVAASKARDKELDGPDGLEPTRYGDWERKGICYDF